MRGYQTAQKLKRWPLRGSQCVIGMIMAIILVLSSGIALASDISGALYKAVIIVSNNSTTATEVIATVNLSSPSLIAGNFMNTDADNIAMRDTAGNDVAFMPGYNSSDWILWVDSIGASTMKNYLLYTANSSDGKIRWFPGTAGGNTTDAAGLELNNSFIIQQNAYYNTDNGVQKYAVYKEDAIALFVSPSISGNFTGVIYGSTSDNVNSGTTNYDNVYGGRRAGQKLGNFSGLITSVQFYCTKVLAPTGTGYGRVRRVSDDSIIGTLGSVDISTIGAGVWVTFNTNTVEVPGDNIRIDFETDGGDAANYIGVYYQAVDTINGDSTAYDGTSWTDTGGRDGTIKIYWTEYDAVMSATGVSSGEHTISMTLNGGTMTLFVDSVDSANTTFAGTVPDNGNVWQFFLNDICSYVNFQYIYANGIVSKDQSVSWEYTSSNFTDASGNGNDLIPSYRTTGNNAYVSTTILSFQPITEATAPSTTNLTSPDDWITMSTITGNFTANVTGTKIVPNIIKDIADAGGTPAQLPLNTIGFFVILVISLAMSKFLRDTGTRSIFIKGIVIGAVMGLFIPLMEFDFWMILYFGILAIAMAFASRHQEFAG